MRRLGFTFYLTSHTHHTARRMTIANQFALIDQKHSHHALGFHSLPDTCIKFKSEMPKTNRSNTQPPKTMNHNMSGISFLPTTSQHPLLQPRRQPFDPCASPSTAHVLTSIPLHPLQSFRGRSALYSRWQAVHL